MSDIEEEAPNRPQTGAEARAAILASLEDPTPPEPVVPAYIPVPDGPEPGEAWVRILVGFPTHAFVIPLLDLTLTQTEWTTVPQAQVAEITQIASENQILLEVQEAAEAPAEA